LALLEVGLGKVGLLVALMAINLFLVACCRMWLMLSSSMVSIHGVAKLLKVGLEAIEGFCGGIRMMQWLTRCRSLSSVCHHRGISIIGIVGDVGVVGSTIVGGIS